MARLTARLAFEKANKRQNPKAAEPPTKNNFVLRCQKKNSVPLSNRKITEFFQVTSKGRENIKSPPRVSRVRRPIYEGQTPTGPVGYEQREQKNEEDIMIIEQLPPISQRNHDVFQVD